MRLPKRDLPKYTVTLPVSKETIEYRPYTVKEERILDLAGLSESVSDKYTAIKQVLENCSNVDIKHLHPADVDFLYLKIYSASMSNELQFNYEVDYNMCGFKDKDLELFDTNCPKQLTGVLNIDTSVKVVGLEEMDKLSVAAKGSDNSRIIDIVDDIKFQIGFKTLDVDITDKDLDVVPIIFELLDAVISPSEDDPEVIEVIDKTEFTLEEFTEFYSSFQPKDLENLRQYFLNTARCVADLQVKCKVCKKTFKAEQTGLLNFLV